MQINTDLEALGLCQMRKNWSGEKTSQFWHLLYYITELSVHFKNVCISLHYCTCVHINRLTCYNWTFFFLNLRYVVFRVIGGIVNEISRLIKFVDRLSNNKTKQNNKKIYYNLFCILADSLYHDFPKCSKI